MSETTSTYHPASVLMNLIITLLTPMFLAAAGNNVTFARQAATETLNAYRAETQSDLITVAKIVGFGLAALAALSLSMAEDLPLSTILRLHASANASDRSEHRNRKLRSARTDVTSSTPPPEPPTPPRPNVDEAALTAAAAGMKARTAENLARVTTSTITDAERHYQATWAASAAIVAAETAASLPTLPPGERASAAAWIDVLNACAKDFMQEEILPRPRAGDLSAMMPAPGP
jgi:hypothetical protein